MKKALALVLALVLALSMAVSAFATTLVELTPAPAGASDEIDIVVVDGKDEYVYYTHAAGTYYIALDGQAYKNITLSASGIVSAELVTFDPAKMNVYGIDGLRFEVVDKNGVVAEPYFYTVGEGDTRSTKQYERALEAAKELNDAAKVMEYSVRTNKQVDIIKVTVADNYTVAYLEGALKISAVLGTTPVSATLNFINDVSIFEYEMVKWAAERYDDVALECGTLGYSDYDAALKGYDKDEDKLYEVGELRTIEDAAVISTTAFRAITGKTVAVACDEMLVEVKNVVAGQKGVNFKHYGVTEVDEDLDGDAEAIEFGFYGKQTILGDYTITVGTEYTWFTLREAFGEKVEEDDIISYYVLKNGKVVKEIVVDYMTADVYEEVVLELNGSNSALGEYAIVMEVPAVEGETNPNTGAESVVGVVAALAVVSVATAAAVSLKK